MVHMSGRVKTREREGRKKGFTYRPRSAESVKRRAERQGGRFDSPFRNGVDLWRPEVGTNIIRILPPTWGDNEDEHYAYQIWVHAYIGDAGTYLCPLKMKSQPCPICKEAKLAKNAGDQEQARQFAATEKWVCWILDREGENPAQPIVYMMSWTMDRDIAALTHNSRSGNVVLIDHPDKGFDLSFKRAGLTKTNTKYFGLQVERDSRPIDDDPKVQDEIMDFITENPIPDLLVYHSAEHMAAALSGEVETKDADLDEDNERTKETRAEGREARGSSRRREEPEEEEEAAPRRSKRAARDEDEEEEERPRRKAKPVEDDDEDEEEVNGEEDEDEDEEDDNEEEEEEEEAQPRRGRREREERPTVAASNGRGRRNRDEDDEPPSRERRVVREERRPRR